MIISFLGSCKKDEPIPPTIINGQVLEQGSNKPLEGVKVVLMEGTYSGLGTGTGTFNYYPIDTVLTDKNGNYSYNNPSSLSSQGSKDYMLWFWLSGIKLLNNTFHTIYKHDNQLNKH